MESVGLARVEAGLRRAALGVEGIVAAEAEVAAHAGLVHVHAELREPLGALPSVLQPDLPLPSLRLGALARHGGAPCGQE